MSALILQGPMGLEYPAHNLFGVPRELTERWIVPIEIIDFTRLGVPVKWFIKRPLIRRGRTLVKGFDDYTRDEKSYWLEAQGKDADLPEYRLGLYDPAARGQLVDWVGRIYGPTAQEQLRMRKIAMRWLNLVRERGDIGLRLAAFPWEYNR